MQALSIGDEVEVEGDRGVILAPVSATSNDPVVKFRDGTVTPVDRSKVVLVEQATSEQSAAPVPPH